MRGMCLDEEEVGYCGQWRDGRYAVRLEQRGGLRSLSSRRREEVGWGSQIRCALRDRSGPRLDILFLLCFRVAS